MRTLLIASLYGGLLGCGITLKRDLREVPAQQVVYDDMCGLQDYHDTLRARQATPPAVVQTQEVKNTADARVEGGRTRFAFDTEFQLTSLRRLLAVNWDDLPDIFLQSKHVEIEVRWAQKAGVRRVVTEEDAVIATGRDHEQALPYHVCLSELLFGDALYQTRRDLLGLPPIEVPASEDAQP